MSVNKGIEMFTKLDKGIESYAKTLEEHLGKAEKVFRAEGPNWGYDDGFDMETGIAIAKSNEDRTKLYVSAKNMGYYLEVYNRDGKPAYARLSDTMSDKCSYDLFGPYFRTAEALGNTVCYMSSENEKDAQLRYKGFDAEGKPIGKTVLNRFGEDIGDREAVDRFSREKLGLSVVGGIVRVPEVYLEIGKAEDIKLDGYVQKLDGKDKILDISQDYAIGFYDAEKKEYRKMGEVSVPKDIAVSDGFRKELGGLVGTEDFQSLLKMSADLLEKYAKGWRTNSFALNDSLKTAGFGIQKELRLRCNALYLKDLGLQKRERGNTLTRKQESLAKAIEKWAKENDVKNGKGYVLSLNRESKNLQASLNSLVRQAKAKGFAVRGQKMEM